MKKKIIKLDAEEQEILKAFENDEFKSVSNITKEMKKYSKYAQNTIKKDKRLNIRISERDLEAIQRKAIEEGIPYQTLISSLIHKFISGRLIEPRKVA